MHRIYERSSSTVAEDVRAVRAEIERLRNVKRRREERRAPVANITKNTWETAVCIGLLADYGFRASVCWLKCKRRRGHALPNDADWEGMLAQLREYVVEADVDHVNALQGAGPTPLSQCMYKTAVQFAAEYKLGLWVRSVNLEKGSSVRTAVLIETYNQDVALSDNPGLLLPIAGVEHSRGRYWAYRWRQRQRASYTSLRNQEALTTEQKERQVSELTCWVPPRGV